MNKLIMLLVLAVSTIGLAQQANFVTTNRIGYTGNGSSMALDVSNSTLAPYHIVNMSSPGAPQCAQPPIGGLPHVSSTYGGDSLFDTNLNNWTSTFIQQNGVYASIRSLTFTLCYILNGPVYENLGVFPMYRHKVTGAIAYGPAIMTVVPGNYSFSNTDPGLLSPASNWLFSQWGTPNFTSDDVAAGNIEIGFRIARENYQYWYMWNNGNPVYPFTNSIRIFGVKVNATFQSLVYGPNGFPVPDQVPVITYIRNSPWANNVVSIDQAMRAPATGTGIVVSIRCNDGVYKTFKRFLWGTTINPGPSGALATHSLSISTINSTICTGSSQLTFGTSVNVKAQGLDAVGNLIGSEIYSQYKTLD